VKTTYEMSAAVCGMALKFYWLTRTRHQQKQHQFSASDFACRVVKYSAAANGTNQDI